MPLIIIIIVIFGLIDSKLRRADDIYLWLYLLEKFGILNLNIRNRVIFRIIIIRIIKIFYFLKVFSNFILLVEVRLFKFNVFPLSCGIIILYIFCIFFLRFISTIHICLIILTSLQCFLSTIRLSLIFIIVCFSFFISRGLSGGSFYFLVTIISAFLFLLRSTELIGLLFINFHG